MEVIYHEKIQCNLSKCICISCSCVFNMFSLCNQIATVVDKRAEATYAPGGYGNSIRVVVEFNEKHTTTGQIYKSSFEERSFGGYDSVSAYRNADEGYKFVSICPTGYNNGNKDLTLGWIYNK